MGRVGMHTAPARIISRAQTVAKIGRLMKKSTKSARPLLAGGERRSLDYFLKWIGLADRLHGRTVDQELDTGGNNLFPRLQAAGDSVLVADRIAQADRALLGDGAVVCLSGDVNKRLAANARDRQDRNRRRRSAAPHHSRLDQLRIPELVERSVNWSLHQNTLNRVVHLLRNEIDLRAFNQLTSARNNLNRQVHADIACSLRWNVNIGFYISVLVNRRQQCLLRNIITEVDRDVPDDPIERGSQVVIRQLALLGYASGSCGFPGRL